MQKDQRTAWIDLPRLIGRSTSSYYLLDTCHLRKARGAFGCSLAALPTPDRSKSIGNKMFSATTKGLMLKKHIRPKGCALVVLGSTPPTTAHLRPIYSILPCSPDPDHTSLHLHHPETHASPPSYATLHRPPCPNPVPLSPSAPATATATARPGAMLPYSGEHRRSPPPPPPPQRAAFSSSLSPSAAPFPPADPVGPGRDLPTAPSVYAAGGDWAGASWMEPPASYMAPAATPPGYQGNRTTPARRVGVKGPHLFACVR